MEKHTAKQRRAIDTAWSRLVYLADQDHSAGIALADALKIERRERGSITAARALIVDCAAKEWPSVAGLYGVSRGCQLGAIVGAEMRRKGGADWQRFLDAAKESRAAHDAWIHASLDAIKVGGGA